MILPGPSNHISTTKFLTIQPIWFRKSSSCHGTSKMRQLRGYVSIARQDQLSFKLDPGRKTMSPAILLVRRIGLFPSVNCGVKLQGIGASSPCCPSRMSMATSNCKLQELDGNVICFSPHLLTLHIFGQCLSWTFIRWLFGEHTQAHFHTRGSFASKSQTQESHIEVRCYSSNFIYFILWQKTRFQIPLKSFKRIHLRQGVKI